MIDDAEVRSFLGRSKIARIATRSPRGLPQIMPLWFAANRGHIYMNTGDTSPTVRNIATDSEVVVLFEGSGRSAGRCLRIRGHARFRRDARVRAMMVIRVWSRYYLSPGALVSAAKNIGRLPAMVRYYRERSANSGVIEVIPESFEFLELPHPA